MIECRVRAAALPDDKAAILDFIMGLQNFEHMIEPDRRIDSNVAEDFCAVLLRRLTKEQGVIFIAEDGNGTPVGWAQTHEAANEIYVVPEERRYAHIAELYVVETAKRKGVGRALIARCEEWAKTRGLKVITIGALAPNAGAFRLYGRSGYAPYVTELRKYL